MKLQDFALLAGVISLVGGTWWIYPPAALILLGLILIKAYLRHHGTKDDLKP